MLYDSLLECGLTPVIRTSTRTFLHGESLIDQFFLNINLLTNSNATLTGNVRLDITDHKLQYLILDIKKHKDLSRRSRIRRIYSNVKKKAFVKKLESIRFEVNECANVTDLYKEFVEKLTAAFDNIFPLTKVSNRIQKSKPWFNDECLKALRKKMILNKRYKKTHNAEDKIKSEQQNKYYKKLIQRTKNQHMLQELDDCKTNIKATWKHINKIIGNTRTLNEIRLEDNGKDLSDKLSIANKFNKTFSEVGAKYGRCPNYDGEYKKYMNKREVNSFFFKDIDIAELKSILMKFNPKKSTNDEIPFFLFKLMPENILVRLTFILNKCIMEGTMPQQLKMSKIIPVYKQGSKKDCNNYRPISLLSYIDKILETAVHSRLSNYLKNINFLCSNQFGFRTNHSTELALLSLMNRIYKAVDSKEYVLLLSIDLRKAFEVIRHDILIDKLENIGIREPVLSWFKSYLSKRMQRTFVNNTYSEYLCVKTGVPQGSSLGPLLFLIYINDLMNVVDEKLLNMFADDTTILITGNNIHDITDEANNKLKLIDNFLKANAIQINETKTSFLLLTPKGKNKNLTCSIFLGNKEIKQASELKFLGVFIDATLNFKKHTDTIINKLRKYLAIFYRIKRILNMKSMMKIYYSNVFSIISYCLLVYARGSTDNLERIERLHRRILKIIFSKRSNTLNDAMKSNNLFSLKTLIKYRTLCLGHKIINDNVSLPNFLKLSYVCKEKLNLRNRLDFVTSYHRTNIGQRCLNFQIAQEWKKLPNEYKKIKRHKNFKCLLKKYLLA